MENKINKNKNKDNYKLILAIILALILFPFIFFKITFWYGGGYGGWAVFVTLPIALVATPIITFFLSIYFFYWLTSTSTQRIILSVINILLYVGFIIYCCNSTNSSFLSIYSFFFSLFSSGSHY